MSTATVTESCEHDLRWKFKSIGGQLLCEMCARIEGSWTECTAFGCSELTAPDRRRCEYHGAADVVECEECAGSGVWHDECPTCDGDGEVEVPCEGCGGDGEVEALRRVS